MVMRKILFGSIVFFSLAFLAACGGGGSGSSGAAGAAGAGTAGATGATGSIALFEDADLSIAYNGGSGTAVPLDTGTVVGKISGLININGMDNSTANSRNRYYMYSEDDNGYKKLLSEGTTTEVGTGLYETNSGDGMIDNRLATSLASTNTLIDWVDRGVAGTTYLAKNFQVCPGNEAGDGACASVLAPAYDRGLETTAATTTSAGVTSVATSASVTYTGTNFVVVSDNATSTLNALNSTGAVAVNITPTKAGYATAITNTTIAASSLLGTGDNVSAGFRPASITGLGDNGSMFSNGILRAADSTYGRTVATAWFAMSADNSTTVHLAEGDNVTLASRPAICTTQALCVGTDNGTFVTNHADLTTAPQIADAGDGTYVILGAGAAITAYNVRDNTTVSALGGITQGAALNNWCSTSSGTSGAGALVVSDNGTTGWLSHFVMDNSSTTTLAGDGTLPSVTDTQIGTSFCALTYNAGTFYLAVSDIVAAATLGDNVSVWKSTDATTWTQIGADFALTGSIPNSVDNIAIGTTGSTAADSGVWVAFDNSTNTGLLHYEDIAGGSAPAWKRVATPVTGDAGSLSMATDGTSVIGVTIVDGTSTLTGFWYNQ